VSAAVEDISGDYVSQVVGTAVNANDNYRAVIWEVIS
jgi:hypothetical protein